MLEAFAARVAQEVEARADHWTCLHGCLLPVTLQRSGVRLQWAQGWGRGSREAAESGGWRRVGAHRFSDGQI